MGDYVGSGFMPSRTGEKWLNFCQLLSLLSQESLNEMRTWPCMFTSYKTLRSAKMQSIMRENVHHL